MTKGELAFLDQMARSLLVKVAAAQVEGAAEPTSLLAPIYLEHALAKGWVSKREPKLTEKGLEVASAFLKR